jgi:hypothetical protein
MPDEPKYVIRILGSDKPFKIPKEIQKSLKGVVSPKMIKKMKFEFIECPVKKSNVPFLECFVCQSHIRRIKGEVHCEGTS